MKGKMMFEQDKTKTKNIQKTMECFPYIAFFFAIVVFADHGINLFETTSGWRRIIEIGIFVIIPIFLIICLAIRFAIREKIMLPKNEKWIATLIISFCSIILFGTNLSYKKDIWVIESETATLDEKMEVLRFYDNCVWGDNKGDKVRCIERIENRRNRITQA